MARERSVLRSQEHRREIEEEVRLAALRRTGLLDTPSEAEFDELVALAAEICRTPIGLFTLVDEQRQWFKSSYGLDWLETPRNVAFCAHTILQQDLMVIEDATQDNRFAQNPLVTGDPGVRFYAGMPLEAPGGARIGTLCVLDTVPRALSPSQAAGLRVLAGQIKARMEARRQQRELKSALRAKESVVAELAASERRFRIYMNNAPFGCFMKDAEGRMAFYNDWLADRFKVSASDWLGKTDAEIWPPDEASELRRHDLEVLNSGRMIENLEEVADPDGTAICWKTYKFPLWNERGEVMLGGFAMDVSLERAQRKELEEANEKLSLQATIDVLTGLPNRRVLTERAEFEYRFALRHRTQFSVLLLDLDNFKKINDQFGHAEGDEVIREAARALQETMRTTDLSARYGGEEFVVLLPGADTEGAILFAERLRAKLRNGKTAAGPVTSSIGIATMDITSHSGERLIQRADAAMYEAKRAGKDRIETHRDILARAVFDIDTGHA